MGKRGVYKTYSKLSDRGNVPDTLAAFPRWTASPMRCLKEGRDLGSPVWRTNLLPIWAIRSVASAPHGPRDSMAIGTNWITSEFAKFEYLLRLSCSALAAAAPAAADVRARYEGAKVSGEVKSQTSWRPRDHANRVAPSAFFLSSFRRWRGSSSVWTSAALKALAIMSFAWEWRACRPLLYLQDRP